MLLHDCIFGGFGLACGADSSLSILTHGLRRRLHFGAASRLVCRRAAILGDFLDCRVLQKYTDKEVMMT